MELASAEPSIGRDESAQSQLSPVSQRSQRSAPGTANTVSVTAPPAGDTGSEPRSETPANPRKRKKASRACDFCHVNHQPCDNGKPKCSVCTKHNKPCLYLRPTKRRGPQKGYRTALNTYKESAAAWGAVLAAIPGLDALIEGHLHGAAGKTIVGSIKDSNQQDALITRWQQSSVFRAFFGHNGPPPGLQPADGGATVPSQDADDDDGGDETPPVRLPPANRLSQPPASQRSQSVSSFAMVPEARPPPAPLLATAAATTAAVAASSSLGSPFHPIDSLSDIVAKDAAQSATRASQTLASLGFAPDETIADFYTLGANPEPLPDAAADDQDFDPSLGSEAEQRAYYELLMGRSFPG